MTSAEPTSAEPTSAEPRSRLRIGRAAVEDVRPLRHAVLRPGWPVDDVVYSADPHAAHFAAYDDNGNVVGVATVFPQPHPVTGESGWRLRGMAVAEGARGGGCGAQLLEAVLEHVRAEGGRLMWCNARLGALGFYGKYGLVADSDVFEVPGGGPHRRMRRELPA